MSPLASAAMRATWSMPGVLTLMLLLLFPIYLPLLPPIDGALFPVTSKIKFTDVHPDPAGQGLIVRMEFTKLRDCEFLGVTVDRDGMSVPFDPVAGGIPMTLSTGERVSRPWVLGSMDTDGLRVRWVHRCNPFFTTVTVGYP